MNITKMKALFGVSKASGLRMGFDGGGLNKQGGGLEIAHHYDERRACRHPHCESYRNAGMELSAELLTLNIC